MDAREGEEHVLLPLLQCDVPYDVQRSRMCLFQEAPPAPLSRGPCREDDPAELVGSKCLTHRGAPRGAFLFVSTPMSYEELRATERAGATEKSV